MKPWINSNYHLVVLCISAAILIFSAYALISDHGTFPKRFQTGNETAPRMSSHPENASALMKEISERLDNRLIWEARRDGASPLISRLYLLKNGTLTDPLEQSESLYPPVPNKWLFDHGLDYTDVRILERDPKHKGFTVLEEFQAGTDPNDPSKSPPLRTKLNYSDADIHKSSYVLEFIGVEEINGRKEFQIRPLEQLPNPANRDNKGNIKSDRNTRAVILGAPIPGAEFLKVVDFRKKNKTINDTNYEVDELDIENTLTGERHIIVKKNASREYQRKPIEVVDSVRLHYQLTGSPEEIIPVNRGAEFTLTSLDKQHRETYKFQRLCKEGILLEKDGVVYPIKPMLPAKAPEAGNPSAVTPQSVP